MVAAGLPPVRSVVSTESTQTDLIAVAHDAQAWPHLSGIRAQTQTAGRGRGGRSWDTGGLQALTASLVLRPDLPTSDWTWLPLLSGLAVVRSLRIAGAEAALKWPNDIVLADPLEMSGWGRWRKVGGVRTDVLADGGGVVAGIGVNLAGDPPVPWATTLAAHLPRGDVAAADDILDRVRTELVALLADRARWRSAVTAACVTVGSSIKASLPDGGQIVGVATALDAHGGLMVRNGEEAEHVVMAGDVEQLRTAAGASGVRFPNG